MTSKLTRKSVDKLEDILGSLAKLVSNNEAISDDALKIILASADIEPTPEILAELQRWADFLQQAKKATERITLEAISEALMQRGVKQASAQLAVSVVAAKIAETASSGIPTEQTELIVSTDKLDFGTLVSNQDATKTIDVEGGPGTITTDSDRILVQPRRFDEEKTRVTITVRPVGGVRILYDTIRIASSSMTVDVPVVVQWSESSSEAEKTSSKPDSTSVPAVKQMDSPVISSQGKPEAELTGRRAGNITPPNINKWKWIIEISILTALAAIMLWIRLNPDGNESITPEQTPVFTPIKITNAQPSTPIEEQIIEQTPTSTALPTNTPVLIPTPTWTPDLRRFLVSGFAEKLLPDDLEWLSGMQIVQDEEVSNEEISQNTSDPGETLAKFEEFGRVGSHVRAFAAADSCNLNSGITYVWMQVILFRQSQGVTSFLDYINQDRFERLEGVGEDAWVAGWSNYESGCTPPQQMRSVEINFRRFNIYGRVVVDGASGIVDDEELIELAKGLASSMDYKLVDEAP